MAAAGAGVRDYYNESMAIARSAHAASSGTSAGSYQSFFPRVTVPQIKNYSELFAHLLGVLIPDLSHTVMSYLFDYETAAKYISDVLNKHSWDLNKFSSEERAFWVVIQSHIPSVIIDSNFGVAPQMRREAPVSPLSSIGIVACSMMRLTRIEIRRCDAIDTTALVQGLSVLNKVTDLKMDGVPIRLDIVPHFATFTSLRKVTLGGFNGCNALESQFQPLFMTLRQKKPTLLIQWLPEAVVQGNAPIDFLGPLPEPSCCLLCCRCFSRATREFDVLECCCCCTIFAEAYVKVEEASLARRQAPHDLAANILADMPRLV